MIMLAKLVVFVIVVMGAVITLNPGTFRTIMNFWKQKNNIYLAGVLRLIFGAIFLLIAPLCKIPAAMYILGILMVIGGITIFVIGRQRIEKIFGWWENKPPLVIRVMGTVAVGYRLSGPLFYISKI